ncbi:hypothetical protein ABVG11_19285 [Streptomyces sp. HD1123-B1]|uniref:hypothetical protein n=1 Tax=Streptomyces huangiella TaxID=3228804 RepID=UPI003D7C66AD
MDLEGIGTLSAAGVALIGIPATVLVGRWQLKGALRTAEATSQAGLAQAQSAYRAALDAVQAETNAAHAQWRRGIQREAYASFLLAVHRFREVMERFADDNDEDLSAERIAAGKTAADDAQAALKAAQTVIELEGPDEVAGPAAGMVHAAESMAIHLRDQAVYARAWGKLGRLREHESSLVSDPARRLIEGLIQLRRHSPARPSRFAALEEPENDETLAARRSCNEALNALPPDAFDYPEYGVLLDGFAICCPTLRSEYSDAVGQFDEAEERFVYAAKMELHGQITNEAP